MIEFRQVSKIYPPDLAALEEVSFSVQKGEFVFFSGPNGAGKSTLLKLIVREERPTSGEVLVAGKNVSRLTRRSIPYLRRSVGLVFQNFRLLQDRTVFDNVALALRVMGVGREEMRLRVTRALRDAGLMAKAHLLPRSLSGGEQQRACIARALVKEPPVLLADEPTGDLDDALAWEIFGLFKEVNARGTTVLVATHRQDLVAQVKRRAITLEHGHLVSDTGR